MIISKTPFRISFFGGGTDLPDFFCKHGGAVLGTAIDKHIYHTVSSFPSKLFDYSLRISYSQVERVKTIDEIQHRPFREILHQMQITKDVEIHIASDLPSFSGLGTSSSFTVGLINALHSFKGETISTLNLAKEAIRIEREVLKESVGYQDQIFAAYGGFKLINFSKFGETSVENLSISSSRLDELANSLMLFFTGVTRKAQLIEYNKIKNIKKIERNLLKIFHHVDEACNILTGNQPLSKIGELLDSTWQEKKMLDIAVSSEEINRLYNLGITSGALGGKVLGAGGGGFMLFFVPPERHDRVRLALAGYNEVHFSINAPGSTIIHS